MQPIGDVSPPKWHLGHTIWFFETFVLLPHAPGYVVFNAQYNYVFNSYYETVGARVVRTDHGNLSRPTVADVRRYRTHVDAAMHTFLAAVPALSPALHERLVPGLNHEEQYQELLIADIKYILGNNPLLPEYARSAVPDLAAEEQWVSVAEGVYEIGATGEAFCFDNELGRHKVYLPAYQVQRELVSNAKHIGRPKELDAGNLSEVKKAPEKSLSVSENVELTGISLSSVKRYRKHLQAVLT